MFKRKKHDFMDCVEIFLLLSLLKRRKKKLRVCIIKLTIFYNKKQQVLLEIFFKKKNLNVINTLWSVFCGPSHTWTNHM